jgi:tetratricopeptide (TPR) repeat protein
VSSLPQDAAAHFFLGLSLHRSGKAGQDPSEAERELRAAIALTPNDHKAHFELGNILEEEGRFAEALPEFEIASRLYPNLGEIWFHLSRMADRAGNHQQAEAARARLAALQKYRVEFKALVEQLKKNPKNTLIQVKVGQVLEKQGKPREAAIQYLDVLRREPNNQAALASLEALRVRMKWPKLPTQTASEGGE